MYAYSTATMLDWGREHKQWEAQEVTVCPRKFFTCILSRQYAAGLHAQLALYGLGSMPPLGQQTMHSYLRQEIHMPVGNMVHLFRHYS